jgi:hypothetical protein
VIFGVRAAEKSRVAFARCLTPILREVKKKRVYDSGDFQDGIVFGSPWSLHLHFILDFLSN